MSIDTIEIRKVSNGFIVKWPSTNEDVFMNLDDMLKEIKRFWS